MLSWKNETSSTYIYYDDSMFQCKENYRTWTSFDGNACEYWDVPHIVYDKKEGIAKSVMPWEVHQYED
ncbi:hypothetical protein [Proteiniclasticum sp.]|uniref:hypothetical protein n=1 Tax=Proteiniclasticum sp. TaxID=2053595 RepID=UPI00289B6401|nr:hypothetical protein [Proteiniclasticum sp.]